VFLWPINCNYTYFLNDSGGRVRAQVIQCEISCRRSGIRTGYTPNTFVFPRQFIPPLPHIPLHLHVALTRKTIGRSLGNFRKAKLFRKSEDVDRKVFSLISFMRRVRRRRCWGQLCSVCRYSTRIYLWRFLLIKLGTLVGPVTNNFERIALFSYCRLMACYVRSTRYKFSFPCHRITSCDIERFSVTNVTEYMTVSPESLG